MSKIVFIGSEAYGYYSGAYKCEGVFVSKEMYNRYQSVFNEVFEYKSFFELDGKHSEVEGSQVIKRFDNIDKATKFSNEVSDYESYLIEDILYDYDLKDDEVDLIVKHVDKMNEHIRDTLNNYVEVSFYLTKDNAEKVKKFVDNLRS